MPAMPPYVPVSSAPLPQYQHHDHQLPPPPPPPAEKPADYVYYERRPDDLSSDARARATAAKVKLQSHYRFALETAIDLNIRYVLSPGETLWF
jgi:protein-serine/threonine kinase